jgi:membrane protein implicated in regulation of membrane protease activity
MEVIQNGREDMLKILAKMIEMFPIKRRTHPPSRKEYRRIQIVLWIYLIIWSTIVYLTFAVWQISWWYKIFLYFVLAGFRPSPVAIIMSYKKYLKKWDELYNPRGIRHSNLGVEDMILKRGVVIKTCNPEGKVRIGNEIWNAVARDETEIDIGENIIVRDVKGMKLFVEKV